MTLDLIPIIFLFSSSSSLYTTIRINFQKHIITCALVHIILRCDLCVTSFTTECSHMDKCVLFVFI